MDTVQLYLRRQTPERNRQKEGLTMTEINRTRVLFADMLNLPRGKYVPSEVAAAAEGIGFAKGVFGVTYDRDLIPVPGCGLFDGIPDVDLHLDKDRRTAWQAGTEIALGDLMSDGAPFPLCARGNLRRTVAEWESLGYSPMVGLESEAYLFQRDEDGNWEPYDTPGAFVYGTGPSNDPLGVMDEIWDTAQTAGIPIESMNGEYDNGQFELTLKFDTALKACDDFLLMQTMAREVALKKGLLLTFMPKPIVERGGSGLHVNFSFNDKAGKNTISAGGKLSAMAEHCIAGMIAHHEGLAGLLATTVNSYDRLGPASLAGYWANWAEDHRLVTIRSSTKSESTARLEHRTGDCATNPYQAVTAVLQAAKLGLEGKLPLQAAEDMDGLENTRETRHVPETLNKALDALEADKDLCAAVGSDYCEALIFLKRDEAERLAGKSPEEILDFYMPFV
jgi:glutamine synthetase